MRKRPCGKLSNDRLSVPVYHSQLVTSSEKITIKRPMISVWILCICLELAAAAFSSKLGITEHRLMGTTDHQDNSPAFDKRPWGSFTVLDESNNYKVKRIEVLPGKRLSYQRHSRRAEHWYVVRGTAKVTLNGVEILVQTGQAVEIAAEDAHRVENPHVSELLVFIETQTGDYFGEDDIERFEDDFGRTK